MDEVIIEKGSDDEIVGKEYLFCRATCPIEYTMFNIAGKWKLVLLWHIYDKEIIRYGELKKCVSNITHKMLSNQLKDLVAYGLVHKEMYHQVPPKVEYSLTKKGSSLVPMLKIMYDWGIEHMEPIEDRYGKNG